MNTQLELGENEIKGPKHTAESLLTLLRKRYAGNEYAVLEQVANETGYGCNSWIDAVVFSLWPSKGLWRAAYEVKISRADFLKELTNPKKNEWARQCFHEFWFVAPVGVIKEEELPENCGWLKPHGETLSVVRAASRRENPDIDDYLLAALARAFSKQRKMDEQEVRKDALANSHDYRDAIVYRDAVREFLDSHGKTFYPHGSEAVKDLIQALNDVNATNDIRQEREAALRRLNDFQGKMVELFDLFCVLAFTSLAERDAAGKLLSECWGLGVDEKSLARQRAKAAAKVEKSAGIKKRVVDGARDYIEVFDIIKERVKALSEEP